MAALLLSEFLVTWGALAAIGMLVTFMIAVGSAMVRGLNLSCSCFGILYRERVGWPTQIRDSVLLAMAVYVIWQSDRVLTIGQLVSNPTPQLLTVAEILDGKRFATPTVSGRHVAAPRLPGIPAVGV